jgi:hypothetical protein
MVFGGITDDLLSIRQYKTIAPILFVFGVITIVVLLMVDFFIPDKKRLTML